MNKNLNNHSPELKGLKRLSVEADNAYTGTSRRALANMQQAVRLSYGGETLPQQPQLGVVRTVADAAFATEPIHPFVQAQQYSSQEVPETSLTPEEAALQHLTAVYEAAAQPQPGQEYAA